MHGWKLLTSVSLAVAATLAASIAPVSAAAHTTRWVDDDGQAGPRRLQQLKACLPGHPGGG